MKTKAITKKAQYKDRPRFPVITAYEQEMLKGYSKMTKQMLAQIRKKISTNDG